jgi:hypothetical protein
VKPLNTPAPAAARRNVCRKFPNPGILKVQRTGILVFKMLRCDAPFGFSRYDVSTNISGALHLAFFAKLTLSQTKKVSPFKKMKPL